MYAWWLGGWRSFKPLIRLCSPNCGSLEQPFRLQHKWLCKIFLEIYKTRFWLLLIKLVAVIYWRLGWYWNNIFICQANSGDGDMLSPQATNDKASLAHKSKSAGKAVRQRGRGDNTANNLQVTQKLWDSHKQLIAFLHYIISIFRLFQFKNDNKNHYLMVAEFFFYLCNAVIFLTNLYPELSILTIASISVND